MNLTTSTTSKVVTFSVPTIVEGPSLELEKLSLEELSVKKDELLATKEKIEKYLSAIAEREEEIKAQVTIKPQIPTEKIVPIPTIEIKEKEAEKAHSLVVNTKQIITSKDSKGTMEHYAVSFISKNCEKIEVTKYPIDVMKYGEIKRIIITDGEKEEVLGSIFGLYAVNERLIKYFSTDFKIFRKAINAKAVDHNGYYSNQLHNFDCQRFSYYLNHGEEKDYPHVWGENKSENYREAVWHKPGRFYSMKGYTASFGYSGKYGQDDMSLHHYVCLADDVFVSKFGGGDIHFTTYKQILDAYFPSKFYRGTWSQEF